ncbi:MAG TPA: hypothetical protein VF613_21020 [Longimicrobium sp.]|jgi:hypothetical protein
MRCMLAALFATALALPAHAQVAPADGSRCAAAPADTARPIIRLDARVTARSLRLDAPASARVDFRPCGVVRVERRNLPERLQPGVTYRDAGVRVLLHADPVLACRLQAALAAPADSAAAACAPPAP